MKLRRWRAVGVLLAVLSWAGLATGQTPVPGAATPAPAAPRSDAPPPSENPVEVQMEEVQIKGEIERPGVFYIIPRREVEMDLGRRTKDYREEILQPLLPGAFERWVRQQPAGPQ